MGWEATCSLLGLSGARAARNKASGSFLSQPPPLLFAPSLLVLLLVFLLLLLLLCCLAVL